MCAYSSTDNTTDRNEHKGGGGNMRKKCHLSLMPAATDYPPANSPIWHSRLVGYDLKNPKKHVKTPKLIEKANTVKYIEVCQYRPYALQP